MHDALIAPAIIMTKASTGHTHVQSGNDVGGAALIPILTSSRFGLVTPARVSIDVIQYSLGIEARCACLRHQ